MFALSYKIIEVVPLVDSFLALIIFCVFYGIWFFLRNVIQAKYHKALHLRNLIS